MWKPFNNIIFGINEGMKCKQVVDFDQSTTTVKEERNKTLRWMNQISYYDPSRYIYKQKSHGQRDKESSVNF